MVITEESVDEQIWGGGYWGPKGAIANALTLYKRNPERCRPLYETALYSSIGRARADGHSHRWKIPVALMRIHRSTRAFVELIPHMRDELLKSDLYAERCEVLTTRLYRIAELPFFVSREESEFYHRLADKARTKGEVAIREGKYRYPHTPPLFFITCGKLSVDKKHSAIASRYLDQAVEWEPKVTDAKQLARVRKGISELMRLLGNLDGAASWLEKAKTTPGIAPDTLAKLS